MRDSVIAAGAWPPAPRADQRRADAPPGVQHLEDASSGVINEAVNQIAFADLILLNKIDLVSEEQLQHARDLVR